MVLVSLIRLGPTRFLHRSFYAESCVRRRGVLGMYIERNSVDKETHVGREAGHKTNLVRNNYPLLLHLYVNYTYWSRAPRKKR